ncbi:probable Ring hydroxylating alpha subunit [Bordetella petrii]|uniref:Probable Ring hydroxylating alpha subunit n=1 Tax=Bordetella petrii (strain ATCC BAA-461 / DSM 12804 / CCUG 43448 / CIP 107267 / Se-1111R) TaxID=340100 RepID=A9I2Q7_BORPD|nr:probable Ring hydroxylating alpha subunit [Bordetella petrii]
MTRTEGGQVVTWVNKCAHRGATICRLQKGNALNHTCVYHQWNYNAAGDLQGVPFRRGHGEMKGMPSTFKTADHGLRRLRTEVYRGLVFATFSDTVENLISYIGPEMVGYLDRIFHKPIVFLGTSRCTSRSNWKIYLENVKDPYHASLLHTFLTTFNIFRIGNDTRSLAEQRGLHSMMLAFKSTVGAEQYTGQNIKTMNDKLRLEDPSILRLIPEYSDGPSTNHIQTIFPQLVVQQIMNSLVARQIIPKSPNEFELVFLYFGYEDDTPEMRELRLMQANLAGPAGYISMEDTEAGELVQEGVQAEPWDSHSFVEMAMEAPNQENTAISEEMVRRFWLAYEALMSGLPLERNNENE